MIWLLFALASVAGHVAMSTQVRHPAAVQARAGDLALNMAVYRTAVVAYARAHPGFGGVVPDGSLSLPSWYVRLPWWSNHVANGVITVYAAAPPPASFTGELQRLSQNSMLAGEARSATGTLHSPAFGDTGIALPAVVPDRAAAWLAQLD